jgi:glycosyl transferase family 87
VATRSESWSPPAKRLDARRWAVATLAGAVLLAASWGALHVGPFDGEEIVDTPVYQDYGEAMLDGGVPYRDFEVEYPPAALPVFLLPSLAAQDDYRSVFEGLMLACALAALAAVAYALTVAGASPRRLYAAVGIVALAPLALGPVILTRYDLWPAALVAGALAALAADRSRLGLGLLAVAAAAKLYPLVLLPLALVYVGRRRGRREALISLAVFAGVAVAIVLPFAVLSPGGLAESVTRQGGRPLQVESLGAALLLGGHQLELYEPTVVSTFGSQNLAGPLPDALATMQTGLMAFAVAAVWVLFAVGTATRARLFVGSAAAVVAFVAFGKVLSPQFLIWLIPLVPLALGVGERAETDTSQGQPPGRGPNGPVPGPGLARVHGQRAELDPSRGLPLGQVSNGRVRLLSMAAFAAALVLTQLWFPSRYWDFVGLGPEAWLVLARDLVLAGLVLLLARELTRPPPVAPRTP